MRKNMLHFSKPNHARAKSVIVLGIILVFWTKIPVFTAFGLSNIGLIMNVPAFATSVCHPVDFACGPLSDFAQQDAPSLENENAALAQSLSLFQRAIQLYPWSSRIYVHLAETYFHLGQYNEAVDTLQRGGWQLESELGEQWPVWVPATVSPLLAAGHYEYYMTLAYHGMHTSQWGQAVEAFRPGLAYRDAPITYGNYLAFFQSAAEWNLQLGEKSPHEQLAAGRYSVLAEDYDQAIRILQPLQFDSRFNLADQAWASFYLGQAYEALGQTEAAIDSYQAGWQMTPEVRQNGIFLLRLFQQLGLTDDFAALEEQLLDIGPTYRPGRFAPGYEATYQSSLPSGLRFVGYDLSVESIADGVPLDFWLWWEIVDPSVSNVVSGPDTLILGSYVLVHQQTPNLLLNGGFEWGEKSDGVPVGWRWRIYTQANDSSYIGEAVRDGEVTHVAVAANSLENDSSGLVGLTIPVQDDEWYLMSGWIIDQGRASLGRDCSGEAFKPGGPYNITRPNQDPIRPADVWVHVVDLTTAFPDQKPDQCSPILINYQSPKNIAMWDDFFMVRIELPTILSR